jgi:hypothetical protein
MRTVADRFSLPIVDHDRPLRLSLGLDALATGAVGLLAVVGAPFLGSSLGTPATLLAPVGVFLLGYAAMIGIVGTRSHVRRAAVWVAVVLNLAWVVASVAIVAAGPFALTAPGAAIILVQAVAVAIFAEWQFFALRRSRRGA